MDLTDAKEFTPVHAESPLKPHCTTSKRLGDPQHGGSLFVLPREIRDEIYSLVRKGARDSCPMRTLRNRIRTPESHFALLAVSKAVGQEFFEQWLSAPNFRFQLLILSEIDPVILLPPKYTKCIKNLHLDSCPMDTDPHSFDAVWGISTECLETLGACDSLVKAALAPFMGAHSERNSLDVDLWYYNPDRMAVVLSSPGFEAFKALVGFRTVTFRVGARSKATREIPLILEGIKKVLEPSLGPATEAHEYCTIRIAFRPRDSLVERVNRDGGRSL